MTQNMYEVAGIKFTVNLSDGLSEASAVLLDNYAPFAVSDSLCASEIVFDVNVERQEGRVKFTEICVRWKKASPFFVAVIVPVKMYLNFCWVEN